MTREETIKALGLMEHVESIVTTYEPGEIREDTTVRELKEACCVAVAALRAQQNPVTLGRSRWEGCEYCKDITASILKGFCYACGRPPHRGSLGGAEEEDWR